MRRSVAIAIGVALGGAHASAGPDATVATAIAPPVAPPDLGEQGIGASLGLAAGGRVTPGGLRIEGHYLYQLAAQDWFDGTAGFTFGGGDAACFRDRSDALICDHGFADGGAVEIGANVRHFFGGRGTMWPYARAGVGVGIARFGADDVTGLTIPFHIGGGVRASVAPSVAVIGEAELDAGFGLFGSSLGAQPQFGLAITAGAEFKL